MLRALADRLGLDGFGYADTHQVLAELRQRIESPAATPASTSHAVAIDSRPLDDEEFAALELPMYSVDGLVRRSAPLQQAAALQRAA